MPPKPKLLTRIGASRSMARAAAYGGAVAAIAAITSVVIIMPYVLGIGGGTFARLAQDQRYQAVMDPLVAALRERLDASGSDRVIDLSQSFDGTRQHGLFGDLYGHDPIPATRRWRRCADRRGAPRPWDGGSGA